MKTRQRSSRRVVAPPARPIRQRGQALLIILVMLILGATYALLSSLSGATANTQRLEIAAGALAQAKAALLGRAVSDGNRPGSLPCPDTGNDGSAELLAGIECPSYLGRLPWRTLGLPDLRDGAGERLWYALSRSVRDANGVKINSDTVGDLNVTGTSATTNVAAIVFAPGRVLAGQSRDSANQNVVTNYLEGENADSDTTFASALPGDNFNDSLLVITDRELMALIEKRAGNEVKKALQSFRSAYGTYPWLAPFADPTLAASFVAAVGSRHGLVPYHSGDGIFSTDFNWVIGSGVSCLNCSGTVSLVDINSVLSGSATIAAHGAQCNWTAADTLQGVNCQAALVFPDTPAPGITRTVEINLAYVGGPSDYTVSPANGSQLTTRSVTKLNVPMTGAIHVVDRAGAAVTGEGWSDGVASSVTTSNIRLYPALPAWYSANDWQRFVVAAVAPGFVPGGPDNCSGGCLTVDGNGVTLASTIRLAVFTTGRRLDDTDYLTLPALPNPPQVRPTANLYDYLDSSNNVAAGSLVFDRKVPLSATFNDQIFY